MTGPSSARRRARRVAAVVATACVRVIGCGNLDAGDDAAGLISVRALRRRFAGRDGVEFVEAPTGMHVLDLLAGARAAVVVDAIHTGGHRQPGATVRIAVGAEEFPAELAGSVSTHGLGIADAIGLASILGSLPTTVFMGIQVAGTATGEPLSSEVAWAIPGFVDAIEAEVLRLLGDSP